MKNLLPPDLIALVLPPIVVAGCIALIVFWVDSDKAVVRSALIVSLGFIPAVFAVLWQNSGLRLGLFRLYYRYFVPNCEIRILGDIPVNADDDDEELLNKAVGAVMSLRPGAEQKARLRNRVVVSDGTRFLTVDAVGLVADKMEEDFLDWAGGDDSGEYVDEAFEEQDADRRVAFNLAGYQGKLTKVDSLLQAEVPFLLERLNADMKRQGAQPMYSLRANIKGRNPFLVFYLKDVPTKDTELFNLRLISGEGDSQVAVNVSLDCIDVSARTPARLLESARRYLASPALDRN